MKTFQIKYQWIDRRLFLYISCIFLVLFKLWLVDSQRLSAFGGSVYDDRLFMNIAKALLDGNWLGPYDNTVLAKGPFYPIWIALVSASGMPLLLAQHILYMAACVVFVKAVNPLLRGNLETIFVFLVLLFNPMSFTKGVMTQVIREGIYPALTILVFACASGLLIRVRRPVSTLACWAGGLGLSLSVLWLTREEGPWVVPGIALVLGAALVSVATAGPFDWKRISVLVMPLAIMFLALISVAALNGARYGITAVTEMKSPEFLSAYGALLRIKHKVWKPTIPVPEDVRERLYNVSPAFAELKPSLAGESGKRWSSMFRGIREICKRNPEIARKVDMVLNMDASGIWRKAFYEDDGDIPGGWFIWAFRESVASAGHYKSGRASREYYSRLAAEINTACAEGRLDCGPERASLMPPWHHEYDFSFLKTLVSGTLFLPSFKGFDAYSDYSYGDPVALNFFRDLTHERLSPDKFNVKGWAFSPEGNINISIRTPNGETVGQAVKSLPSPDVYWHFLSAGSDFPAAREARFDINGSITGDFLACKSFCYMHIDKDGKLVKRIPLDGSVMSMKTRDLHLHLDFLGLKDGLSKRDKVRIRILGLIGNAYQFAVPLLAVLAFAFHILDTWRVVKGNSPAAGWIISTSILIAVLCRLIVLSLIHITSFPAIIPQYLAPVSPLVLIFIAVVLITNMREPQFWRKKVG